MQNFVSYCIKCSCIVLFCIKTIDLHLTLPVKVFYLDIGNFYQHLKTGLLNSFSSDQLTEEGHLQIDILKDKN